jgi:hypothetical protein
MCTEPKTIKRAAASIAIGESRILRARRALMFVKPDRAISNGQNPSDNIRA